MSIQEITKDAAANSTLHGLPRLVRKDGLVYTIFWSILMILALASLVYCNPNTNIETYLFTSNCVLIVMIENLIQYLAYETVQGTRTVTDSVITFPAVTICSLIPFNFGKPRTSNFIQDIIDDQYPNAINSFSNRVQSDISEILDYARANIRASRTDVNGTITDNELEDLGFAFQSMVLSCYFNGKECKRINFTWSYSYEHGNCYTFNKLQKSALFFLISDIFS